MASPHVRENIAEIIVESVVLGDEATCKKHGLSERTLFRYRARSELDPKLSAAVRAKRAIVEKGWADEIPAALRKCIEFLAKAAERCDPSDPEAIHSIAGAMKLLSETSATWKVLDARLARSNRPAIPETRPASSAGADVPERLKAVG